MKEQESNQIYHTQTSTGDEDSVQEDLKKLRSVVGKIKSRILKIFKPFVKKGAETAGATVKKSSDSIEKNWRKTIKPIALVMIGIFIVFLGIILVRRYVINVVEEKQSGAIEPTIPPFKTYEPSIYADDDEVVAIEDELSILENEIDNVRVIESSLAPPVLDFDVSFDEE